MGKGKNGGFYHKKGEKWEGIFFQKIRKATKYKVGLRANET